MGISKTFESRSFREEDSKLAEEIKTKATELENLLLKVIPINRTVDTEVHRHLALARTNLEQSIMWAVKALSRK